MKAPKRSERRQADSRVKARSKRRLKSSWVSPEKAVDPRMIGKHASVHDAECSCQMCRSPRRSVLAKGDERLTRQEVNAKRGEREEREDSEGEAMIQRTLDRY